MAHVPKIRSITHDGFLQIAMGQVPSVIPINGIGRNPAVATTLEDVWPLGGIHTDLTTGTTLNLTSSAAADTSITFFVLGLDANWDIKIVYATTNASDGRTAVQVGDANNWVVIYRMWQVSAAPAHAGDIYLSVGGAALTLGVPDSNDDVQCFVDGTTIPGTAFADEQMWGYVPRGYKLMIKSYSAEINNATGTARAAEIALCVASLAYGTTIDDATWMPYRHFHDVTVNTEGNPHYTEQFAMPFVFDEYTKIKMVATATSTSDIGAHIKALLIPA